MAERRGWAYLVATVSLALLVGACGAPPRGPGADGGTTGGATDGGTTDGGTTGGGTGPGTRTSATIGFPGGTLTLDGATVTFPVGALATDTRITLTHTTAPPTGGYQDPGKLWTLGPAGAALTRVVTVTLPWTGAASSAAAYWSAPNGTGYERLGAEDAAGKETFGIVRLGSGFVATDQGHKTLTVQVLVARATVAGARPSAVPVDLTHASTGVFLPNQAGGLDREPSTAGADGVLRATGVPPSPLYYVTYPAQLPSDGFEMIRGSRSPTIDATWLGDRRFGPTKGSPSTSLGILVHGLAPWRTGDELDLTDSQLVPYADTRVDGLIAAGGTTMSTTLDWKGLPLIDTTQGDSVFLTQSRTTTSASGLTVTTLVAAAKVPSLTMVDGQHTTVTVTLTALGASDAQTVSATVDRDAFTAALTAAPPTGTHLQGSVRVGVEMSPAFRAPVLGWSRDPIEVPVLGVGIPAGTGVYETGSLPYELPFASRWQTWPMVTASATWIPGNISTSISCSGKVGAAFPSPLTACLGPLSAPQVNGLDASGQVTGATTTPELSWQPPKLGTATSYDGYLVQSSAPTGVRAIYLVPTPDVRIPKGILTTGDQYLILMGDGDDHGDSGGYQGLFLSP